MMNFNDLPGVSEVAIRIWGCTPLTSSKTVSSPGPSPLAWKYRDLGSMAAVDRTERHHQRARNKIVRPNRVAGLVGRAHHVMTGFENRFTALIRWFFCFVGSGRSERAIVADLDRLLPHVGRRGNPSP